MNHCLMMIESLMAQQFNPNIVNVEVDVVVMKEIRANDDLYSYAHKTNGRMRSNGAEWVAFTSVGICGWVLPCHLDGWMQLL